MAFLEDTAIQVVAEIVKGADFQVKLRALGQQIGLRLKAAAKKAVLAPSQQAAPGTWEREVLQPMIDPLLAGIQDATGGALYALAGAGGGLLLLTHALAFFGGHLLFRPKCGNGRSLPPAKGRADARSAD